jgi:hypothetical protein
MARQIGDTAELATGATVAPALIDSLRRVSWGAVMGGVVVALITHLLLSMLGIGIGVATIEPATGDTPGIGALSLSAALWWTVSGIIAAFVGGWVAARLSGALAASAALHGLVTWATTTLVVLFLMTSAVGALMGGALGFLGNTISGASEAAKAVAPQLGAATEGPLGDLRREIESAMQSGTPSERARTAAATIRAITKSDLPPAEMDQAAGGVAQLAGISSEEARERLTQWRQTYQSNAAEFEAQARAKAEEAARTISRGAFAAFVALLLGAAAGAFGGRIGAPRNDVLLARREEVVLSRTE